MLRLITYCSNTDERLDNQRIVTAIRAAEAKTSGEIYGVIAHACGGYHLVPVAWAALPAFAVPWPLIQAC